jgi:hypothetical protein
VCICWKGKNLYLSKCTEKQQLRLLICGNARRHNSITYCFTMAWFCASLFILSTSYFPCYWYTTCDICPTRYKRMTLLNCRCFLDTVHAVFTTYFRVPYIILYNYYYYFQLRTAALRLIVRSWLDVPTFATRCLHACHHTRAPSGGRRNCGPEMSGNFA